MEKFAEHKDGIKLVISDVVMPRKCGKAVYNEIKEMSETVKFLFVSGHAHGEFGSLGELDTEEVMMVKPLLRLSC